MIHDSIVAVVVITAVNYIKNMEVPRNFVSTVGPILIVNKVLHTHFLILRLP